MQEQQEQERNSRRQAAIDAFQKKVDSWVGADELDLVRQVGEPANTYQSGNRKLLTYRQVHGFQIPGGAFIQHGVCVTTFESVNGRIVNASWKEEGVCLE